jgi:hypothetical protein
VTAAYNVLNAVKKVGCKFIIHSPGTYFEGINVTRLSHLSLPSSFQSWPPRPRRKLIDRIRYSEVSSNGLFTRCAFAIYSLGGEFMVLSSKNVLYIIEPLH